MPRKLQPQTARHPRPPSNRRHPQPRATLKAAFRYSRSAAKELYESGRIGAPQRALWRQILRLSLAGIGPQLVRRSRLLRETFYAAWWWTIVALSFTLAWFAVMILPGLVWRWRAIRATARAALTAIGVPVAVAGLDRVPRGNAMLVFNHSSYMDALVLSAVLPGEPLYVVKRELGGQIFAGPFLRRLGAFICRALRRQREPRRHGGRHRRRATRPQYRVLSRRHIHPQTRAFRFLSWCFQGSRGSWPANRARHYSRNAVDAAR